MIVSNGTARADVVDFVVQNLHGSIVVLRFESDAAKQWVDEHIPANAMPWGRNGIAIEPRYVADVLRGIVDDGLTVQM